MLIKKLFKLTLFLIVVASIIYTFFFYIDFKDKCYIRINPSFLEFSNLSIKRAIKALKFASFDDYRALCENVKVIHPNVSCGGFQGGCYYPDETKSISITTSQRGLLSWTAGIIVHEVCHAKQHKEGRTFDETECYKETDRILKKLIEL